MRKIALLFNLILCIHCGALAAETSQIECNGSSNTCVGEAQQVTVNNVNNGYSAQEVGFGFIALAVPFGFWQWRKSKAKQGYTDEDLQKRVTEAVAAHNARSDERHAADAETIKSLTAAVTTLAQGKTHATQSQMDAAFEAFHKGDFSLALRLFEIEGECFENEAKKAAEIQRHIGALAYLDDTQKSLKAYRRATQLDPDNAEGWNHLGRLLARIGKLNEAIDVYQTVLNLKQENRNEEDIAWAYNNLGEVYRTNGELEKAMEYYKKALQVNEGIPHEKGIAANYCNLGNVYLMLGDLKQALEYYKMSLSISKIIGDDEGVAIKYGNIGLVNYKCQNLDKADEYFNKSLRIHEAIGSKEGMAIQYCNLGNISFQRKDYKRVREYWNKSFSLFQDIGSPNTEKLQDNLNLLPREK